jgi:hypothetical protein
MALLLLVLGEVTGGVVGPKYIRGVVIAGLLFVIQLLS